MGKMNPERKAEWTAALRSGEYKQTNGFLHRRGGFCCLGVACDLWNKETGKGEWKPFSDCRDFVIQDERYALEDRYSAFPPNEVTNWLGVPYTEGYRPPSFLTLANMNDSGKTFLEIADWIEENL